jgi:hypothetical protein
MPPIMLLTRASRLGTRAFAAQGFLTPDVSPPTSNLRPRHSDFIIPRTPQAGELCRQKSLRDKIGRLATTRRTASAASGKAPSLPTRASLTIMSRKT